MTNHIRANNPLVSVVMPAYNAAAFLEDAVRSVMRQTVSDWELLVIDDGSRDETCAVVERLAAEGFGRQPPVVYRALDFLVDHGLAHRIRRLNAFAACMHPGEPHQPAFLICDSCNTVAEAPATRVRAALEAAAAEIGFAVARSSIEATGRCPACRKAGEAPCA